MAHMFQDGDLYLLVVDFFPQDCDEDGQFIDLDQAEMGGDSVSSVAAVREAQARQRAASRNDRRRCLNCCTVGAPRSASAIARSLKDRAPLQLGNPAIFKLSHYRTVLSEISG